MEILSLTIIIELITLSILSRHLTQKIFTLFLHIFSYRTLAVSAITALFFPGTVIHELSHLFVAEILGVKTGKLTLVPEGIEEQSIRAGSVEIFHTDPFRRSIIGLAPFFIGIIILCILSSLLPTFWEQTIQGYTAQKIFSTPASYFLLLTSYLIFCVSNSMFTSSEDMKGVIPLGVVMGLMGIAIYLTGFRISPPAILIYQTAQVLSAVTNTLTVVLLLNGLLFVSASGAIWLAKGKARKG